MGRVEGLGSGADRWPVVPDRWADIITVRDPPTSHAVYRDAPGLPLEAMRDDADWTEQPG